MTTFLFWNLNRRPLGAMVGQLAKVHDVDVVILIECTIADEQLLSVLNSSTGANFNKPFSPTGKVQLFSRLPHDTIQPVLDDGRLTVRRLIFQTTDILLAALHFPSKVNWNDRDQQDEAGVFARHIAQCEAEFRHRRTVVVGDFNMNPFEHGMSSSHGFHGVMTRTIARRVSRTVNDREYPFFYNPMWSCFGDRTEGPPGTHYYDGGKPLTYFWNVYDQVLIRPDLLDRFHDELSILDSDGVRSLLTSRGRPDIKDGSDHLPLLFRLDL